MKTLNLIPLTLVLFVLTGSCKKDIYGCKDTNALNHSTEATKDDGSCIPVGENVKIEEFWVDFSPSNHYDSYIPNFYKENGDLLIVEVESGNTSGTVLWSALPYHLGVNNAYMRAEYTESGLVWIETLYEDGTPANWTGNATYHMRVALIKKNGLIQNPDLENMTINELEELL